MLRDITVFTTEDGLSLIHPPCYGDSVDEGIDLEMHSEAKQTSRKEYLPAKCSPKQCNDNDCE